VAVTERHQIILDVLSYFKEFEKADIEFFIGCWNGCTTDDARYGLVRSFRRQMMTLAASEAFERLEEKQPT
jgi:hypothetical protein